MKASISRFVKSLSRNFSHKASETNISTTAGFASGPRSRWADFWRSFPAPFSMILQPKTMMPCLYAGMLVIPSGLKAALNWMPHVLLCFPAALPCLERSLCLQHLQSTAWALLLGYLTEHWLHSSHSCPQTLTKAPGKAFAATVQTKPKRKGEWFQRHFTWKECCCLFKKPETKQDSGCLGAWSETENMKECPEDGSQVQGDSNEQQLLAMHPSAAGVPRPQRFQSALPVTRRFTRPSVWAQTAHSLPSFAAQTFTTQRQYRVCYGLANEQLFKPIDSPSSLLCSLAGSYMNENTACSFSCNTGLFWKSSFLSLQALENGKIMLSHTGFA